MRIARVPAAAGESYAVLRSTGDVAEWAVIDDPFAADILYTGEVLPVEGTPLLAPVTPRVVVGIAHNKTNNEHHLPIQVWHKSVRSVAGPGAEIPISDSIGQVNIEGELALVIGKPAYKLTLENAMDAVFGYTIANDVTNVDQVPVDERFFQAKSGVNYAPIGPWVETEVDDPDDIAITVSVNGTVLGESGTANLPSTLAECLVYVTQWLELGPGDVVISGAPRTFFPVGPGDVVDIALAGLGTLTNTVVREEAHV